MDREATVSVILYKSKTLANGEHPIMLRISQNGKRKHLSIGISCNAKYWDVKKHRPKKNHPNRLLIESIIDQKRNEYNDKILEFKKDKQVYTPTKLVEEIEQPTRSTSVWEYFEEKIDELNAMGKVGNANAYKDARNSLKKCFGSKDLLFQDITIRFLKTYENWLRQKGLKETTLSVYFRTLRALYNFAVEEKIVSKHHYPFDDFKVTKFNIKTKKRAITKEEMHQIGKLELEPYSKIWEAQQYFLFMYYAQGISIKDMAKLKWKDIVNNRVNYERSKTRQLINFKVSEPIKKILDYFHPLTGDDIDNYIFPILNKEVHITPSQIDNRVHKITGQVNKRLKEIGKALNLPIPLTTYIARHTYATVLKYAGVETSKIGQALGHTSTKTTEIYLKGFEDEVIDQMNEDFL